MQHARRREVVDIDGGAGAFRRHVGPRQRLADERVGRWILQRRFGIELEVELAAADQAAKRMPAPPAFGRTSPLVAMRSSGFMLRRCAARSISALRAVAAACRICMPPRWMPLEPAVRPWSGVSAVSPSINLILSTPMPSSSAAICGMAMRRPWPRSTLPQ